MERYIGLNTERINKIRELIEAQGRISLDELMERFKDYSSMTLRRDLIYLEEQGEIIRVRGGAISVKEFQKETEDFFHERTALNVEEKKIIAEKCASILETGLSIFIDSGSTSLFLVKQMLDVNYTIITNGINIALELARKKMPAITILGGMLSRNNFATSGMACERQLEGLNINMAIMGTTAFTLDGGFTCGSQPEAELKRLVLKKAKRKIMLMDSSKVDKVMPYTFAAFGDIDVLISDGKLPQKIKDAALEYGVTIM